MDLIITAFQTVLSLAGEVVNSLFNGGPLANILPFLLIGTGVTLLFVGVKVVKSLSWGH